MRFTTSFAAAAFTLATVASAAQFAVEVGKNNENVFDPPFLTGVQAGDMITFRFTSKSHSVTQSTFDKPCETKAGGVDSLFQTVNATTGLFPEWTIQIDNVTTPHWFYCAREPHCSGAGMVFAINPTAERTFEQFQAIARGQATPNTTSSSAGTASPTATGDANNNGGGDNNTGAASSTTVHKTVTALAAVALIAGLTL